MFAQPAFAMTEQLVDLSVPNVVVLFLVEHGQQHVEVRKGVVNGRVGLNCQPEITALTPLRELLVQRDLGHLNRKRLTNPVGIRRRMRTSGRELTGRLRTACGDAYRARR